MKLIKTFQFKVHGNDDGTLVAIEGNINIPFTIKRIYYVSKTSEGIVRGCHAHRKISQIAVCISGSCRMVLDNGQTKESILLDRQDVGLLLEPSVWHEMHHFTSDCVLLVLANDYYDENDYIRDYQSYLKYLQGGA